MSAIRHADTRRPDSLRESASGDVDELAWPPSSDDLDAIDVVSMAAYATELKTHRPPLPQLPARQQASGPRPALPNLPDVLAIHDLADADADAFRSEATQSVAAADSLVQGVERGRSWTPLALYTAASIVVLTTMSWFVWIPAASPDLPQVAEVSPAVAPVAPLSAPAPDRLAAEAAVTPDVAMPAPAVPREPDVALAPAQPELRAESQRAREPESQRVLRPDVQSARPVETMARSTVPAVMPPGALPTPGMEPTPVVASRAEVVAAPAPAPAAPITPIRTDSVPEPTDDVGVQAALQRYEAAYSRLDARAAQAVWPSVDARALERAFENLESQSLQFDRCDLDVRETVAKADCLGTATYVRRIGSKAPRTEPRVWTFNLRKTGEAWHILSAAAR